MVNISDFRTVACGLLFVLLLIANNSEEAIIKSVDPSKGMIGMIHWIKHQSFKNTLTNGYVSYSLVKHPEKNSESLPAIETKAASEVLGITDPNLAKASDMAEFLLSIVANVLTIWGFGQQQDSNKQKEIDDEKQETETAKLVGKWNSTLDGLNTRMEDIKRSLRELNCRLDEPQALKNKGVVSQECLQFVQPLIPSSTRVLLAPRQTGLLKKTMMHQRRNIG